MKVKIKKDGRTLEIEEANSENGVYLGIDNGSYQYGLYLDSNEIYEIIAFLAVQYHKLEGE